MVDEDRNLSIWCGTHPRKDNTVLRFAMKLVPNRKAGENLGTRDKDASSPQMKREADTDGTEETLFGKKPKLDTVSAEEIK